MSKKINSKSLLTTIYVFIMLAVFPLATNGNYFDILDVKWMFAVIPTCLYLIATLIIRFVGKNNLSTNTSDYYKFFWISTMLFIAGTVIGTLFCSNPLISFWGITGRYLGIMVIVPLVIAMLQIAKRYKQNRIVIYGTAIAALIIFLIQIFNEFKIDPFGMWEGIQRFEKELFASTIGNLNFNATYNCMVLSIALATLMNSSSDKVRILKSVFVAIGFAASICIRSNGVFLGLGVAVIIALIYTVKHTEKIVNFAYMIASFATGSLLIAIMYKVAAKSFKIKSLSALAIDTKIIILEFVLVVVLYLVSTKFEEKTNRIILLTLSIVSIAVLCKVVFFGNAAILDYSEIDDHTMHNRVYVWRKTIEYIKTFGPIQFLFGCGINDFQFGFVEFCGAEMQQLGYKTFIDAHSEFLQAFASTGLIGFVGYLGMLVTTIIQSFRDRANENTLVTISFITAFMAQGLVYGPQITTTPLLFIMLGVFWSKSFKENEL